MCSSIFCFKFRTKNILLLLIPLLFLQSFVYIFAYLLVDPEVTIVSLYTLN